MVNIYNIYSETESLNENLIQVMETFNGIKPILTENWHGVCMGFMALSIIYLSEKPSSSCDIARALLGLPVSRQNIMLQSIYSAHVTYSAF